MLIMALTHFQYDLFISYAHDDNEPLQDGSSRWIESFSRQLRRALRGLIGIDVEVWRDRDDLSEATKFTPAIKRAIASSAVILPILSRSYLNSQYCRQELEWFCEANRNALDVSDYSRVIPILLYDISHEEWPHACSGLLGFRFHDGDGYPTDPESATFSLLLRRLASDLNQVLNHLRDSQAGRESYSGCGKETTEDLEFNIFLGTVADNIRPVRRGLAVQLKADGNRLLDETPPPYEEESHGKAVEKLLKQADLSVHLLDSSAGEPVGARRS